MGIPIYNLYITRFDKINGHLKGCPTNYKDENFDNKDVCLRSDVEKYIYDLKNENTKLRSTVEYLNNVVELLKKQNEG